MRSTRTRLGSRLRAAAGVAITVTALAGCSGAPVKAGSAAIVEGRRIPVSALDSTVSSLLAVRTRSGDPATPSPELYRDQLRRKVVLAVVDRAAAAQGVSVTEGEVAGRRQLYLSQAGGQSQLQAQAAGSGIAPGDLDDYIRESLLTDKIGAHLVPGATGAKGKTRQQQATNDLLVKTAQDMDVTINPRYGTWAPSQGSIEPTVDSFVVPSAAPVAPTATPTPAG